MFEKLVDGADDVRGQLAGIVAYGLYKIAKREWVADLRAKHKRKPSEQELEAYVASWTATRIDGLRSQAAEMLGSFSQAVIAEADPSIRRDAIAGEIKDSLSRFESSTRITARKLGLNIALSMAGALFCTLILFLILLALTMLGVDIVTLASNIDRLQSP